MKHFLLFVAVALFALGVAQAQTVMLPAATATNLARSCSFQGKVAVKVTTGAASAATGAALPNGNIRVICSADAHYVQSNTVAPTATANDSLIKGGVPETFFSEGDYYAFIQDTAAGVCYLTPCR